LQTTGRPMGLTYLLLFLTLTAFAQNKPRIQVLPNPQSLEDFEHEFKGCPENSECDQVMGHMLSRWKTLISKLKEISDSNKNAQALELFRSKYGIPVEFYTNQKSQLSFKPVLHSSPCRDHNLKTTEKILRGMAFIKSISNEKAVIWRDQSQIEIPLKDHLTPQPVKVYYETGPVTYQIPINDQPLFIKNRELYILKEEDGFYFNLKISENGNWQIVNLDMTQLSTLEEKRQEAVCPTDKEKDPGIFSTVFCKTVWDMETKKTVTMKLLQGCLI
jgi:hypothetical protein